MTLGCRLLLPVLFNLYPIWWYRLLFIFSPAFSFFRFFTFFFFVLHLSLYELSGSWTMFIRSFVSLQNSRFSSLAVLSFLFSPSFWNNPPPFLIITTPVSSSLCPLLSYIIINPKVRYHPISTSSVSPGSWPNTIAHRGGQYFLKHDYLDTGFIKSSHSEISPILELFNEWYSIQTIVRQIRSTILRRDLYEK